jgi:PII-like signaling protein
MNGYQVSFLTVQAHRHAGKPVAEWLLQVAMELGLQGATIIPASEGFGKHRRVHSSRFFELADQPVEVVMAVTEDESQRLFERVRAEGVHLFYVKAPVEFGEIGGPAR